MSFLKNNIVKWGWLISLIAFPILLWILPSDFFDVRNLELCPSKFFFDIECWGCGISRAVMHFHHLEFDDAAYYNKIVFVIYPFLTYVWFTWVYGTAKRLKLIGKT